jgi:hypothetical protein
LLVIAFLASLAKYKRDGWSSVLHVFPTSRQWPHFDVLLVLREDHFFGAPTFSYVTLPFPKVSDTVKA